VVAVVIGEAEPLVQRARCAVVGAHLQIQIREAVADRAGCQRGSDRGGEALPTMLRRDFDRGQARPVAGSCHPADGDRFAIGSD
jgi:hypothetical protein